MSTSTGQSTPLDAEFRTGGGTRSERARSWWRRHRFWLLAGTALLAVTVGALVAASLGGHNTEPLSIDNPAPDGAQAAASVLRSRGVQVTATDSLNATLQALESNGAGASTVLVYDPLALLQPDQAAHLAGSAKDDNAAVVALSPGPLAVKEFSPEVSSAGTAPQTTGDHVNAGPACSNSAALAAGTIDVRGVEGIGISGNPALFLYRGAADCFAPGSGTAGFLATNSAGDVTVLGSPGILSNQRLANQGNAALAFRLLGSRTHLLWYTVSLKDVPVASQTPTLAELMPSWIFPASAWLLLVAVLGMLWRGRRHGPLVAEPLPVLVKASETVTGRARLYQDARARDTAVKTLQQATLTRLARQLRLGTNAAPSSVVEATAAHTGRQTGQLEALLITGVPLNDKQMLTMAAQLAALEEEVAPR